MVSIKPKSRRFYLKRLFFLLCLVLILGIWYQRPPTSDLLSSLIEDDQPHLVLHMGPGKTGTTSLQYMLTSANLQHYSYQGRYYYASENGNTKFQTDESQFRKVFSPLVLALQELPRQGIEPVLQELNQMPPHVVVSDETLVKYKLDDWKAVAQAVPYDVTVVVTHRPYYSWMVSKKAARDTTFRNTEWLPENKLPQTWHEWKDFPFAYKATSYFLDLLQEAGIQDVRLVKFGHHMVDFCRLLEETCPSSVQLNSKPSEHYHHAIALHAAHTGYINTTRVTRLGAVKRLQELHPDPPALTDCLNKSQLDELEEYSWQLEQKVPLVSMSRKEHRAGFVAKNYCWMNMTAVLEEWKSLLHQL